jgi:hypothetical protein
MGVKSLCSSWVLLSGEEFDGVFGLFHHFFVHFVTSLHALVLNLQLLCLELFLCDHFSLFLHSKIFLLEFVIKTFDFVDIVNFEHFLLFTVDLDSHEAGGETLFN